MVENCNYEDPRESTVIVVGAGPAGLATAACLTQNSIPYILLEREHCSASLWRIKSYDRLHLHLPKQTCELPFMKMPPNAPKYPSKADFVQYLDNYAAHFNIKPLCQRRVDKAWFDEGSQRWHVRASNEAEGGAHEEYLGRFLVVATGEACDPFCPEIEGLSKFQGKVMHSTEYKNGKEFEGKSVLVVGAGNSGMEIALDLANHGAMTSIVVRSPIHLLSTWMADLGLWLIKYVTIYRIDMLLVFLSKLIYGDITRYGLRRPPSQPGPLSSVVALGKYPIIDQGTFQKIKSGQIKVLPAVVRRIREGNYIEFEDGKCHHFDAIIFATGFRRSTNQWLQPVECEQSHPNWWRLH